MSEHVLAMGYTSVVLVINMDSFVPDAESQRQLNSMRATPELADLMRNHWPVYLDKSEHFERVHSGEDTGYVTGVFRRKMFTEFSAPEYRFLKNTHRFDPRLWNNWQFKNMLRWRSNIWKNWEIFIRPTITGMFAVRLVRRFDRQMTPIETIARYTIELQQCFNIPSAIKQLDKIDRDDSLTAQERYEKKASVYALLKWLRVDKDNPPSPGFIPVQWQLALEVCNQFVRALPWKDHKPDDDRLQLYVSESSVADQLHDSYVIYHLDGLATHWSQSEPHDINATAAEIFTSTIKHLRTVQKGNRKALARRIAAIQVRQALLNLLEGAILSQTLETEAGIERDLHFPIHSDDYIDRQFDGDVATWHDELCLLTSRAAIIIPSKKAREEDAELYISSLPAPIDMARVPYEDYWMAIERSISFMTEIRVLAQILEQDSTQILREFGDTLRDMRADMLRGRLAIQREKVVSLVEDSANLVRLVGLAKSLSNPHVWSRAEFAVTKADKLLDEMRLDRLLAQIDNNISNLNSLVDHIDELYLAELSEGSNRSGMSRSIALTGVSLLVITFTLPSFWKDAQDLNPNAVAGFISHTVVPLLIIAGSIGAIILVGISLAVVTSVGTPLLRRAMQQRLKRLSQTLDDHPSHKR